MKIKTKSIRFFALALVLLISIVSISAFGVGCVYSNENPLKLSPGESSEIIINLQNDKEIQLKASILGGSDIAEFSENTDVYNIPNTGWVNAKLKISVPASASIGKEYIITLNFLQASDVQKGTVGLNTAMEKSFKVLVVEKPTEETPKGESISLTWWMLGIVAVIAIIAIIWFIVKNKED